MTLEDTNIPCNWIYVYSKLLLRLLVSSSIYRCSYLNCFETVCPCVFRRSVETHCRLTCLVASTHCGSKKKRSFPSSPQSLPAASAADKEKPQLEAESEGDTEDQGAVDRENMTGKKPKNDKRKIQAAPQTEETRGNKRIKVKNKAKKRQRFADA